MAQSNKKLQKYSNHYTYPNIFVGKEPIKGFDDTNALYKSGILKQKLAAIGIQI